MLGERLRERVEELIARYVTRMRNDPAIPRAKALPSPLLEDHAMSFLGDLFQSIVVLEKAEALKNTEEADLLKDGTRIQRLVADLHGRQRQRMGWTEEALHREYEILDEEVASLVKRHASTAVAAQGLDWALDNVKHLVSRAHDTSVAAFADAAKVARAQNQAEATQGAVESGLLDHI